MHRTQRRRGPARTWPACRPRCAWDLLLPGTPHPQHVSQRVSPAAGLAAVMRLQCLHAADSLPSSADIEASLWSAQLEELEAMNADLEDANTRLEAAALQVTCAGCCVVPPPSQNAAHESARVTVYTRVLAVAAWVRADQAAMDQHRMLPLMHAAGPSPAPRSWPPWVCWLP